MALSGNNVMKSRQAILVLELCLMLLIVGLSKAAGAGETPVWAGDVYSSGVPVNSSVLNLGITYRIEASEVWFYDYPDYLAADAQYYTTSSVDTWDWLNHYRCPNNHSFLRINGQDVDWGPFSNGDTNHAYNTYYVGDGAQITFAIVDWNDSIYTNNYCHIHVEIYSEITVGGRVVDSSSSSATGLWIVGAILASIAIAPLIIRARKTGHR
jgi:hypothetical protein